MDPDELLYQALFSYIESKSSLRLTETEQQALRQVFTIRHPGRRELLLQEGEVCRYMAFIVKGAGRMYAVNSNGKESTIRFAIESWWLGDYESYNLNTPSRYFIEMCEDSDVLLLAHADLQQLLKTVPAVDRMIRELDRKNAIAMQQRLHSSISLGAEERYKLFADTYPEFIQRFPLGVIASYLGVSPETLSRIRKSRVAD